MHTLTALASTITLLVGCLSQWSVASGCSERERLVRDLTKSYATGVEPDTTVLQHGIAFQCSRYDRTSGELLTSAYERYRWTDTRLRWEPRDYDQISVIRVPSKLIWIPDFKTYNSLHPVDERDQPNAVVFSDGSVLWIPRVLYRTHCTNERTGDGLNCQIISGSWTYDADMLKLEKYEHGVDFSQYLNSTCPFTIHKATAVVRTKYYPCCKEPYSTLEVNFNVHPKIQSSNISIRIEK